MPNFSDYMNGNSNKLGPLTLRKSSTPVSALLLAQMVAQENKSAGAISFDQDDPIIRGSVLNSPNARKIVSNMLNGINLNAVIDSQMQGKIVRNPFANLLRNSEDSAVKRFSKRLNGKTNSIGNSRKNPAVSRPDLIGSSIQPAGNPYAPGRSYSTRKVNGTTLQSSSTENIGRNMTDNPMGETRPPVFVPSEPSFQQTSGNKGIMKSVGLIFGKR